MDRFVTSLERRFGRYAPSGITLWMVGLSGVAYLMLYLKPELYTDFTLEPHSLAAGEWWRLVTFLFLPWSLGRTGLGPIWTLFALLFLYTIGNALEQQWGSFRFDLFYLLAALATIASGLLFGATTNFYINQALLLAFASEFPDYEILLFFVLPIKMRWIGLLTAALVVYQLVVGNFPQQMSIAAAMAVLLLFIGPSLLGRLRGNARQAVRQRTQTSAASAFTPPARRSRICAKCGRSEKDDPSLEFRVCDCAEKCHGKLTDYCIDHARAH